MKQVKVAAATVNQIPLAWQHNRDNLIAVLQEAKKQKVQVLCCPELAITGYGCEDAFLALNTCQMALQVLEELIPHTENIFVGLGLPLFYKDNLYNAVAVVSNCQLLGFVAKQHMAGYGVHYEPRWFKPWPRGVVVTLYTDSNNYPCGDLTFTLDNLKIGFEICEDAWVPARTGIDLAVRGVDIILNPSASHFAFYKYPLRQQYVLEGAKRFNVIYLYASLLGNEAGRIIYDGDTLIATPAGFAAMGLRFSFRDYVLVTAEIDIEELRLKNLQEQMTNPPSPPFAEWGNGEKEASRHPPLQKGGRGDFPSPPTWENSQHLREEEFSRAVALGLFDYLRKSKSRGYVLSLSGGADSSSCVCLVYLMVKFALQELSEIEFRRKLNHISLPKDPAEFMQTLLYCLYQRTENSTEATENAARKLTKALGASYSSFAIDDLVETYCQKINPLLERPLSWKTDDLALQNIQARVRAPAIWLLANVRGALLLTSCNRSEVSVGYATMDGDTCGSVSPIAGVSKSFIKQWLQWLEKTGPENLGPIPELKYVTVLEPSAELRSKPAEQTDEQDLMPYPWLDDIQRMFVLEKLSPLEISQVMQQIYPLENPEHLANAIERFFTLWSRNQWKRERLAPSFHLDMESVDPKTWCRYPILSGDFKIEIKKMRDALN